MSDCGLPNEFCFLNLKIGAKIIGGITIIISLICSVLLIIYLASDFDEIAREIADNDKHLIQQIEPHKSCKNLIFLSRILNVNLIINFIATVAIASVLLVVLLMYSITGFILMKGVNEVSSSYQFSFKNKCDTNFEWNREQRSFSMTFITFHKKAIKSEK
jgi:Ni,Fe-hydrogenase I cytochrome b subunit